MKRLVYVYVSNGAADEQHIPQWCPGVISSDPFCDRFLEEGFCYLFNKFIERKLFDEILVVIESNRSPGSFYIAPGIKGLVVPHINELRKFLYDDDVLWARGGWKSWFPFLQKWHDDEHWLLFYRAASNRGAWTFWDIVLDDLITEYAQDNIGRFYYPINKPINPDIFYTYTQVPHGHIYDLMIGASHVHDKKGQFKMLPILLEYRKQFGVNLKCVMPGSLKHGVGTSGIAATIKEHGLEVQLPGMVDRRTLRYLYCQSRIFVHCGAGGQNDRGPLEAMSCGTPVMLANEEYHAPCIRYDNSPCTFDINPDNPELAAGQINKALTEMFMFRHDFHQMTYNYFQDVNGIDEVIYPQFEQLFSQVLKTPHNRRQDLFDVLLGQTA